MVILPQTPARMGLIAVRTEGTNDSEIIGKMKDLFSQLAPDEIFEVNYLTDRIENFYSRERNHFRISGAFSLLALILSVMGLFGISLLSISKREKEIGIRKVNGSSVAEILLMLNSQFLRWVLAAVIISVPLSLWILSLWLQRFAYRTEMSWWIFALAGLSAVLIAILTVSWQSWRAATRNPVDALRYE
jgi:putative ABC transport system permease protein